MTTERLFARTLVRRVRGWRLGLLSTAALGGLLGSPGGVIAAENEPPIETVVITAQKRGVLQDAQTVPLALTGIRGVELEARQIRTLEDVGTAAPNVTLADAGTIQGFANFSIRGLGTNSTIPSVEPTVGLFVDGVYLGMSAGAVVDLFDVESVEILRGPQGLLFGRNTTGGAVLINSRRPDNEFSVSGRANYETGPQFKGGFSVDGPLGHGFAARLSGYYSNDRGWFENSFDGDSFGEERIGLIRPILTWEPSLNFDATLIGEYGSMRGVGAPAQNPAYFSDFDIGIDEPGYNEADWLSLVLETNLNVAAGLVTNVFGYRKLDQGAGVDIDAQPVFRFHAFNVLEQHQISDELRFAGRFYDRLDVTAGLYYFTQEYFYLERRRLFGGAIDSTMGAEVEDENYAGFAQADFDLTPDVRLIAGGRYTVEEKTALIATFVPSTAGSRCNFVAETCNYNFPGPGYPGAPGSERWDFFTPKLGFEWDIDPDRMLYGFWTRGARSGGYNVRNTSFVFPPGPYGPELQNAFELGLKSQWLEGRLRLNGDVFLSTIEDLQRDVNVTDPVVGIVQVTRNTADATIKGVELEAIAALTDELLVDASLGYTEGSYDKIYFDLDGGGIGASDLALKIPRLSKWSLHVGATYATMLPSGYALEFRAGYAYRSSAAATDNNSNFLSAVKDLTGSAAVSLPDGHWRFSVYGRNLLNTVTEGVIGPLPATLGGGAFQPLNEGRTIGLSASFSY